MDEAYLADDTPLILQYLTGETGWCEIFCDHLWHGNRQSRWNRQVAQYVTAYNTLL